MHTQGVSLPHMYPFLRCYGQKERRSKQKKYQQLLQIANRKS